MQKHFNTYSAINISKLGSGDLWLQIIERQPPRREKTVLRKCFNNAETMQRFSTGECERLNRQSVVQFLQWHPAMVRAVFELADKGYILNREFFREGKGKKGKFPDVHRLEITEDRFIAVCKVLEKYGIFYRVYGENFVCFLKGV